MNSVRRCGAARITGVPVMLATLAFSARLADASTPVRLQDTVVITVSRPPTQNAGRLIEELSLGGVNARSEHIFGEVAAITLDQRGRAYVVDRIGAAVRVYDSTGAYLRDLSRSGSGPGEYRQPHALAISSAGEPLVIDRGGGRLHLFDTAGRVIWDVRTQRLASDPGYRIRPFAAFDAEGLAWVAYDLRGAPAVGSSNAAPRRGFVRFNRQGAAVDTIATPVSLATVPMLSGGPLRRPVPFARAFHQTLSPKGYFVSGFSAVSNGFYSVELRLPPRGAARPWRAGDPITSLRVPFDPVPLDPQERRDWRSTTTAVFQHYTRSSGGWSWNAVDIPTHKPAFKSLWVDQDGRIWVELFTRGELNQSVGSQPIRSASGEPDLTWPAKRWRERRSYDVIEPSGRYLGRVELQSSESIIPHAATGNVLWAAIAEPGAIIRIKRYRIDWER